MDKPLQMPDPAVLNLRGDIQKLVAERNRMADELNRINGLLICLLRTKHEGRAFVSLYDMAKNNGLGIKWEVLGPLRSFRVTVVTQDGLPLIPAPPADSITPGAPPVVGLGDGENGVTPEAAPNVPSAACEGEWHRNSDALGRRCPECGSTEKMENVSS